MIRKSSYLRSIAWVTALRSSVRVSNSSLARSRKSRLAWFCKACGSVSMEKPRLTVAALRRNTADARHRLPGTQFEHFDARAFEQRSTADCNVGHGHAAVAAVR